MSHTNTSLSSKGAAKDILIVDDDAVISHLMQQIISKKTPHHVHLAGNGLMALEVVQTMTPDLIFLDYLLPDMDGIQLYDQFCALYHLEVVPTIMMSSALPRHAIQERGLIPLEKPFAVDELLRLIDQFLT